MLDHALVNVSYFILKQLLSIEMKTERKNSLRLNFSVIPYGKPKYEKEGFYERLVYNGPN